MKTLLHLIASPRGDQSNTLKIGKALVSRFRELHPDGRVDTLDLFAEPLPSMTLRETDGKYRLLSGKELDDQTRPAWEPILAHIRRFLAADVVVISSPMWNFGMPYPLKHYFDVIIQPRHTFRYTQTGPEGLAKGKRVFVVTSRGGDYRDEPAKAMDQLEPPLRVMLGFIGIPDPLFINAQPMLAEGPEVAAQRVAEAVAVTHQIEF